MHLKNWQMKWREGEIERKRERESTFGGKKCPTAEEEE